ncbi:MAG: DUF3109 family protein [Phycisphaerales bacterium]|nr:DUF3109 family protein [Phycisphaerales bacterium]
MIAIDNVLLSDDVIEAQFVCDLERCKGGCCVDGDCGAPLTEEEAKIIAEILPKVKPYLPAEYIAEIERQGTHVIDDEHGIVTPTINGGICVYAYTDNIGIVKCGIEAAYRDGLVEFKKPISCHLFPIRIDNSAEYELVNYEPRKTLCRPACKLGKKLEVPVYQFLKEPLIRKFGAQFYEALDAVAQHKKDNP